MVASANKKTVKNVTIKPFEMSGTTVLERVDYRFDSAESWRNALLHSLVVLPNTLQDVRRDAIHEIRIAVDSESMKRDGISLSDVDLVVLTRDNFTKKVFVFARQPLSEGLELSLTIARSDLELTSLSRRIDFEIMILVREEVQLKGKLVRRSARLAKHVITVSAENKGISFNFIKTSPADFIQRGVPAGTTFHLELNDANDLIEQCDDINSVLKVLVHEDAWLTLQEIRSGNQSGEALGTMMGSELVLAVLGAVRTRADIDASSIEAGSLADRILGWLAASAKESQDELKALLFDESGLRIMQAHVQDALKLTRKIRRVRLDEGDDE